METLREEKTRLEIALETACAEERRAYIRMRSGFLTFRMYVEFQDQVSNIRREVDAVSVDIMTQ